MAKSLVEVLVLNALVPVYWFVYTYCVSGYGLDFLNGPLLGQGYRTPRHNPRRATLSGAAPFVYRRAVFLEGS